LQLHHCYTAEYCAKGSLADVLKAGSASTQKAAQLTWLRRLNMVRLPPPAEPLLTWSKLSGSMPCCPAWQAAARFSLL
jgi:hypothetical protein